MVSLNQKYLLAFGLRGVVCASLLTTAFIYWNYTLCTRYFINERKYKGVRLPGRGSPDEVNKKPDDILGLLNPVPVTAPQNTPVLYNRITKSGSTTMSWAIDLQSKDKGFHINNGVFDDQAKVFTEEEQKDLAESISSSSSFSIYIRHLHFVDFHSFGLKQPLYINILRNPVERFISKFYFRRFGFAKNNGTKGSFLRRASEGKINLTQTLDECMLDSEQCFRGYANILAYFCGQEAKCRYLSEYAMEKAKMNLVRHFTVVGILEDMDSTLKVFEAILPKYFKGISEVYRKSPEINGSKTLKRVEPSTHTKDLIRKKLDYEMQFYYFARKRFYLQFDKLKELKLID